MNASSPSLSVTLTLTLDALLVEYLRPFLIEQTTHLRQTVDTTEVTTERYHLAMLRLALVDLLQQLPPPPTQE